MPKTVDQQLATLRNAREKAKPKAEATPLKQSWRARQRRPGIQAAENAKREAAELETLRWRHALETVVHFFEAAGFRVRRTHDDFIVVEDVAIDLPRRRAAPRPQRLDR